MTRPKIQNICDFCGKEIAIDSQEYTVQFSQKGAGKGRFVKDQNKADMCHKCFLNICQNGFVPKWVKKIKDEQTGKWNDHELEEQATL